jgi:hypothetical protein
MFPNATPRAHFRPPATNASQDCPNRLFRLALHQTSVWLASQVLGGVRFWRRGHRRLRVMIISRQHQRTTRSMAVLCGEIVGENMRIAAAVLLVLDVILVTTMAVMEVRNAIIRAHKSKIAGGRFPAPLHGQIVEGHTRVELFDWYSPIIGFGFCIFGIVFIVIPIYLCPGVLRHPRPSEHWWVPYFALLFFAAFVAAGAGFTIGGAAILRLRKRFKNRPPVIIDDGWSLAAESWRTDALV